MQVQSTAVHPSRILIVINASCIYHSEYINYVMTIFIYTWYEFAYTTQLFIHIYPKLCVQILVYKNAEYPIQKHKNMVASIIQLH